MKDNERIIKETLTNRIESGENFTFSQICNEVIKNGGDPVLVEDGFSLEEYLYTLQDLEVLKYSKKFNEFIIQEL